MVVLDTNVIIEKLRSSKQINENITEVTVLEYLPIVSYTKFYGRIHFIQREDIILAFELQVKLRRKGKPKGVSDLLIFAICINYTLKYSSHVLE
ncbi:MAG: DNA-binding protein [Candidatus Methanomethylicia archaeon]